MQFPGLIVQKFGGATLADPAQVKHAAQRVAALSKKHPLIVVVSAMGKTTDSLIALAREVSPHPHRRELDMLLSVGERMSMSLLSMAMNDLGCPAISFTGSQAGIMTDDAHVNAFIQDVKPIRVIESLQQNKVVILAGFQGVSPKTKEITTLGRGGSDTTATALAAFFKAQRCDILKQVPSIFTADPRIVPGARPLHRLSYQQLADMTFWGAKVLHYRSAELALTHRVPLYIGPASDDAVDFKHGTVISEENPMFFEAVHFIALNSHEHVCVVNVEKTDWHTAIEHLRSFLESKQLPLLQILQVQKSTSGFEIWMAGPEELVRSARTEIKGVAGLQMRQEEMATVTMTCTGSVSGEAFKQVSNVLKNLNASVRSALCQSSNITFLLAKSQHGKVLTELHTLIEKQK
jgi:aspartate kinase